MKELDMGMTNETWTLVDSDENPGLWKREMHEDSSPDQPHTTPLGAMRVWTTL